MGFAPVSAQYPVVRWNRQAAELSFGVPEGWLDVELEATGRERPPIASVVQARSGNPHRVLVYRGAPIHGNESTYALANLARLAIEVEHGQVIGSPVPLLVAGERAFLSRYRRLPFTCTEVWVASEGIPYRLALCGPPADHEACLPFFLTMLATLRWGTPGI